MTRTDIDGVNDALEKLSGTIPEFRQEELLRRGFEAGFKALARGEIDDEREFAADLYNVSSLDAGDINAIYGECLNEVDEDGDETEEMSKRDKIDDKLRRLDLDEDDSEGPSGLREEAELIQGAIGDLAILVYRDEIGEIEAEKLKKEIAKAGDVGISHVRDQFDQTYGKFEIPDLEGWKEAKYLYDTDSRNNDNKLEARDVILGHLTEDFDFATPRQTSVLWSYDSDTGVYDDTGEVKLNEVFEENLGKWNVSHERREVGGRLRGLTGIEIEEFDAGGDEHPDQLIPLENGVLNFETDELLDHDPKYYFRGTANVEYDPDAECPRFEEFVHNSAGTEADALAAQEFAGYTLMHWSLPHRKALWVTGPTQSGKSTFLKTISTVLDDDVVSSATPQDIAGEKFIRATLDGKWANINAELNSDNIGSVGTLKGAIAGDEMTVQHKNEDPFSIRPTAKHAFAMNEVPGVRQDDDAFFERVLLVTFPRTIPPEDRDPDLLDKFDDEKEGILQWMLDGLRRLIDQGGFSGERHVEATKARWAAWSDPITRFRTRRLLRADEGKVPLGDLHEEFVEFCEEHGLPSPASKQKLRARLTEIPGIEKDRVKFDGNTETAILGVWLLDEDADLDGDPSKEGRGRIHSDRASEVYGNDAGPAIDYTEHVEESIERTRSGD